MDRSGPLRSREFSKMSRDSLVPCTFGPLRSLDQTPGGVPQESRPVCITTCNVTFTPARISGSCGDHAGRIGTAGQGHTPSGELRPRRAEMWRGGLHLVPRRGAWTRVQPCRRESRWGKMTNELDLSRFVRNCIPSDQNACKITTQKPPLPAQNRRRMKTPTFVT
jgi:hypothetical protein